MKMKDNKSNIIVDLTYKFSICIFKFTNQQILKFIYAG
ncbi:MAG: hypothetical protein OJF59_002698 [Cytophagales bacterium]|nr:MAG: hypothetical protein OJF59_002698 [Cytophagales bacterium]